MGSISNARPPDFDTMARPSLWYGRICYETYPCQHKVIAKNKDGLEESGLWSGVKIYQWLIDNNLPVDSHFERYKK